MDELACEIIPTKVHVKCVSGIWYFYLVLNVAYDFNFCITLLSETLNFVQNFIEKIGLTYWLESAFEDVIC